MPAMRRSAIADGAALRWEDYEAAAEAGPAGPRTAPPRPSDPHFDAIAEAAALRWRERHETD